MDEGAEVWVVVPAYNEAGVIGAVLGDLARLPYRVVVVDDGSGDGTVETALRFPVVVLRHVWNLGQGAALQTGLRYAVDQPGARFVVTFDADGQHRPADIAALLAPLRTGAADVTLGSRFLRPGDRRQVGVVKRALLRTASVFTRLTSRLALTDTHNGLRAFTVEAAARVTIRQNGMAHASELLDQIARLRLRYCEVPVTIAYTEYSVRKGQSIWNSVNIVWDIVKEKMR